MRSEHTRQTRWGQNPEVVDEEQIPPGSTYVKQVIWVPCTECDLQVHTTYVRLLMTGVTCPECGRLVAGPSRPECSEEVRRLLEEEEQLRRQL
jgi:endogenous inhibitor of DNA gyrase (YacG/DUF329 family)